MKLMIGRVIKSHGIRGEVVVDATTDAPEERFAVGTVLTGTRAGGERELTIAAARPHKNRLLIAFEEISDRTEADSLRGMCFFAEPLDEGGEDGSFYDHELIGLRVVHEGADIGEITEVSHIGSRTLLTLALGDGHDALIPFVHEIVPEVDLAAGLVRITPPAGLLEL